MTDDESARGGKEAPLTIGAGPLTCADIVAAASGARPVALAHGVLSQVEAAHRRSVEIVARRHVYGRTTGVGANRDVTLRATGLPSAGQATDTDAAHVRSLLRSHATTAGPVRSAERVRGMLVVRLNQLAVGASGVRPEVVEALLAMLQAGGLPVVRELGGVGTGDLAALAAAALTLTGERPTSPPVPRTVTFGVHDALPFLSSGAATIADSALAQVGLDRLARAGVVVAALTFTAVRGNPEAFSPPVERAATFAGTRRVCRSLRALVDTVTPGARIQDPYGLRALPQVQGMLVDELGRLAQVTEGLAGAAAENPLIVVPAEAVEATEVPHNGAFHLAPLATSLDTTRAALVQAGQLVQRRIALLVEPAYTSLSPFLSDGTAGSSGVMPLEYVAASALAELVALATPTATGTTVLSRGAEDDASFASTAARLALQALPWTRVLLACELVCAVRALRRCGMSPGSPPQLHEVLHLCQVLPDVDADRDLTGDLDVAVGLLDALADVLHGAGTLDPT